MFKQKNGFSLIELIVCLIIVGILSQIGFIAFQLFQKGKSIRCKDSLAKCNERMSTNRKLNSNESFTFRTHVLFLDQAKTTARAIKQGLVF